MSGGGGRSRGQTQQDFAVGISVFLLAVLFVFNFVPTTIAPGGAESEARAYTADRVVTAVVSNVTDTTQANTLDRDRTAAFFDHHGDGDSLRANLSLAGSTQANVTLETLAGVTVDVGGVTANAGDAYTGDRGASASRVVRLGPDRYRLVVRVW